MSKLSRMCCVLLCGVIGRSAIVWVTETPQLTNKLEIGISKWHCVRGSLVLCVWQSIRLHIIDMMELYAVPQIQEQDWSSLLFSDRLGGFRPSGNEIATTS